MIVRGRSPLAVILLYAGFQHHPRPSEVVDFAKKAAKRGALRLSLLVVPSEAQQWRDLTSCRVTSFMINKGLRESRSEKSMSRACGKPPSSIVAGVVKKAALADNLAVVADRYFGSSPGGVTAGSAWAAVFAFSMQIFFDFSGYTDIAIGCALLLGYHFPMNFRRPYLAVSITDFWQRWHMSLSSWLRDYVYIPLGGNRRGRARTYANLLATMLVGGLWHGANWNFVMWGGYHGLLLAMERVFGISARTRNRHWSLAAAPLSALTFLLVSIGWVFFRAANLHHALAVIRDLATRGLGEWPVEPTLLVLVGMALLLAVFEERGGWLHRVRFGSAWAVGLCAAVLLFVAEIFAAGHSLPFVYFQF